MPLRSAVRVISTPLRAVLRPSAANPSRGYSAVAQARSVLEHELDTIRAAGTWKGERVITSKQGPHINVDGSRGGEQQRLANKCPHNVWSNLERHELAIHNGTMHEC